MLPWAFGSPDGLEIFEGGFRPVGLDILEAEKQQYGIYSFMCVAVF